jgi:hypothetical protein
MNDDEGGPVVIVTGAPGLSPGLMFRSIALSLIVSALTWAPYDQVRSSHSQPLPTGAPLK